jgi:stage V sporulation protein R
MVDELASHATRIQRHIASEGFEEVEAFLDACLSLDNLIDIYAPYGPARRRPGAGEDEEKRREPVRFQAKSYMDPFINPPEFLEEQRQKIEEERKRPPRFPERAERDVLLFLAEHAPLRGWQRDVLSMVREEAYYFAPQRLTKVMNEGWACLAAGSRVFTDRGLLPIDEIVRERLAVDVSDGEHPRPVYDWARFGCGRGAAMRSRARRRTACCCPAAAGGASTRWPWATRWRWTPARICGPRRRSGSSGRPRSG